ncbi:MAG: hypothetical protein HYY17_10765 [Planctomycetes bacterium]|nr:hypothetical protein [Planctomycetota bacterium]
MEPIDYQPKFDGFRSLMGKQVRQILLVSSLYDAFVLEEDGLLGDKLLDQYVGWRLKTVPAIRSVSTGTQALKLIQTESIDLVLCMKHLPDMDTYAFAEKVKRKSPDLPVVLLLTDPAELKQVPPPWSRKPIDRVFLWNNNPDVLLAIVKSIEDLANVDHDTATGGVRVVLIIEDTVAQYSSLLCATYKVIMDLTQTLIADSLNDLHRQLRMRSRAKVLLAETYEDAMALYRKYRPYMVGVISDIRFWRDRKPDGEAGLDLARAVRAEVPDMPILLQSNEPERNGRRAQELGVRFLDKNSASHLEDFRSFVVEYMGFGDFVFRMPDGSEVARAANVDEMRRVLRWVPAESVVWHAERNHFSHWLVARTELTIADRLRPMKVSDFPNPEEVRKAIADVIEQGLAEKQSDVVAQFSPRRLREYGSFLHLGKGSMGGKGRSIAFLRYLLARSNLAARYPELRIEVPYTMVIGAEEFSSFLDRNQLRRFALECDDIREICRRFDDAPIAPDLARNLRYYVENVRRPIAVRSSSLLEDSHLQPFAGLYATIMLPNNARDAEQRLAQLVSAVKIVWASTFGPDVKGYFRNIGHRMEEEAMAVVVQDVVGSPHGRYFYPTFSGAAQSYNFYPVSHMLPTDGVAQLALGMGKMVVDGGATLRFCPKYPQLLPQYPTPEDWLHDSQTQFYGLDLDDPGEDWKRGNYDGTLQLLDLSEAETQGVLQRIGSTYDPDDNVVRDSLGRPGPRIVTFAPILKHNEIPLPPLLSDLLVASREALGCPVEIEFAVDMKGQDAKPVFALLQIRPFATGGERDMVQVGKEHLGRSWCHTHSALGNGVKREIRDIVYVVPRRFDRARTPQIAQEIGEINARLAAEKRPYVLIGFGRWGSFDPWLGIGVNWGQISGVRVLIEAGLAGFNVDPSQGTHFFQNMTALGIGFLSVPHGSDRAFLDWDWLESLPVEAEVGSVRHVRFPRSIEVRIDGRTGRAAALRPEE